MVYILIAASIFFGDLRIKNYVERNFPEEGEQFRRISQYGAEKAAGSGGFVGGADGLGDAAFCADFGNERK